MKRYLKNLSVISLLVVVGVYILSEKSFSDDFIIHKTIDTHYKKVAWNLNLINSKPELIDNSTIFLGSSIVQGGINDSLLNSKGINAINMGVPHNGNEMALYFQNRILNSSKPKKIIYLKGKIPYAGLHKLTPLLYTSSELIKNGQTFNIDYINFLFKRSKLSLEYIFFNLMGEKINLSEHESFLSKNFGQINVDHEILNTDYENYIKNGYGSRLDENFNLYLNDYLFEGEKNDPKIIQHLKQFKRKTTRWILNNNFFFNRKNQQRFIGKAFEQAENEGINVQLIYIPILMDVVKNKGYLRKDFVESPIDKIGLIHLNSYAFLAKRSYWDDIDHLNLEGSIKFTERIVPLIKND